MKLSSLSNSDYTLIAVALAQAVDDHDEAIRNRLERRSHRAASAEMAVLLRRKGRLQSLVRLFNEASNTLDISDTLDTSDTRV